MIKNTHGNSMYNKALDYVLNNVGSSEVGHLYRLLSFILDSVPTFDLQDGPIDGEDPNTSQAIGWTTLNNGIHIVFNSKMFKDDEYDVKSLAFVLMHEAMHILFKHIGNDFSEYNKKDHRMTNIAMDSQINAYLSELDPFFAGCVDTIKNQIDRAKNPNAQNEEPEHVLEKSGFSGIDSVTERLPFEDLFSYLERNWPKPSGGSSEGEGESAEDADGQTSPDGKSGNDSNGKDKNKDSNGQNSKGKGGSKSDQKSSSKSNKSSSGDKGGSDADKSMLDDKNGRMKHKFNDPLSKSDEEKSADAAEREKASDLVDKLIQDFDKMIGKDGYVERTYNIKVTKPKSIKPARQVLKYLRKMSGGCLNKNQDYYTTYNRPSFILGEGHPGRKEDTYQDVSVFVDVSGSMTQAIPECVKNISSICSFCDEGGIKYLLLWDTDNRGEYRGVTKAKINRKYNEMFAIGGGTALGDGFKHLVKRGRTNFVVVISDMMTDEGDYEILNNIAKNHQVLLVLIADGYSSDVVSKLSKKIRIVAIDSNGNDVNL